MHAGAAMVFATPFFKNRTDNQVCNGDGVLFRRWWKRTAYRSIRSNFWRDFDRLPAQALTQDAQQPEFRALHCNRATVQADEFLDHPSPLQFFTEPLCPVRQN